LGRVGCFFKKKEQDVNTGTKLSAPISVNLELTADCNLRCFFCFCPTEPYQKRYVSIPSQKRFDNLIKILHLLKKSGVLEARFFGGEFSLIKEWKEIMSEAKRLGFFISFVSNGTLFSSEDIDFIKSIGMIECGVSLHGLKDVHDKVTGVDGSFDLAVNSIQKLQNIGVEVAILFTPNKINLETFEEFIVSVNKEYGIKNVCMNRLYKGDGSYGELTMGDYLKILEMIHRIRINYGFPVNLIDSFPRCKVPVKYWKYLLYCAQGIAFGQINYLGEVKNCASLSVGIGNIFEDDLSVIWEKKLADFRTFKHLPLSCRLCPTFCGGGCIASRTMKNNFIADEFIKLPVEENFLESIFITLKNYFKKWIFQVTTTPNGFKNKKIDNYPVLNKQYKIRKESENCYVGLFDGKGMLILDQFGVDAIKLMNGKNSLEDIGLALNCSIEEVESFARTVL